MILSPGPLFGGGEHIPQGFAPKGYLVIKSPGCSLSTCTSPSPIPRLQKIAGLAMQEEWGLEPLEAWHGGSAAVCGGPQQAQARLERLAMCARQGSCKPEAPSAASPGVLSYPRPSHLPQILQWQSMSWPGVAPGTAAGIPTRESANIGSSKSAMVVAVG